MFLLLKPCVRKIVWILLFLLSFWGIGLAVFLSSLPRNVADPVRLTDGILVLTGGSGRIETGLGLLRADQAQRLLISGVHGRSRLSLSSFGDLAERIDIGIMATDTIGNSFEAAAWVDRFSYHSVRVVTAAYHMPRSLLLLSRRMPGVEWVPHPVFPLAVRLDRWWWPPRVFLLLIREYHKYIVALTYIGLDYCLGGRLLASGLEHWWSEMPVPEGEG